VYYSTISRPTITLWEHREALKYLKQRGLEKVDEDKVFKTIEQLRKITEQAVLKTKSARRQKERTKNILQQAGLSKTTEISGELSKTKDKDANDDSNDFSSDVSIKRFEDIQLW
jgi:putative transposase